MDTQRLIAELPGLTREVEEIDQALRESLPDLTDLQRAVTALLLLIADLRANR